MRPLLVSFFIGISQMAFGQALLKKSFTRYRQMDTISMVIYKFFKNKYESEFGLPDTVQFGVKNNSKTLSDFTNNDYYSLAYNAKCESIFDSDQQKVFYRFNYNDTFQFMETTADNRFIEFPAYLWELPQLPYGGILSSYRYRLLKRSTTEEIYETKNRKPFPIRISVDPNSLLINYIVHNNETFIDSMILNYSFIKIKGDKQLFTQSNKNLLIKTAMDVLGNSEVTNKSVVDMNKDSCKVLISQLLPLDKYNYIIGDFWHIHCAPCIKNMRMLEAMNLDSSYYLVGLNDIDSKEAIINFKISNDMKMDLIRVPSDIAKCFDIAVYPTTIVLREGLQILRVNGFDKDFKDKLQGIITN
jgi:hypothetical protein